MHDIKEVAVEQYKLFSFYEKIYFHEMETREKIYTRVQINIAIFFTGISVLSYMLRMLDFSKNLHVAFVFIALILVSLILTTFGIRPLLAAFWGNEYKCLATLDKTEKYKNDVIEYARLIDEYNNNYPENKQEKVDIEKEINNYIYEQITTCASHNTYINDKRFANIHSSIRWLLIASVPFLIASALFIIYDLDASSPRKETIIYNRSLVEKLHQIDNNIKDVITNNKETLEAQLLCQTSKDQIYHRHHLLPQQHHNHEESSKTVNHQGKSESLMSEKKVTPPPPPPPPQKPTTRAVLDHAEPKKAGSDKR